MWFFEKLIIIFHFFFLGEKGKCFYFRWKKKLIFRKNWIPELDARAKPPRVMLSSNWSLCCGASIAGGKPRTTPPPLHFHPNRHRHHHHRRHRRYSQTSAITRQRVFKPLRSFTPSIVYILLHDKVWNWST